MTEYIKRDDAINGFVQMLKQPGDIYPTDITTMLQSIPPADVRPVVRGHWEIQAVGIDGEDVFCSVCKCGSNRPYWPFCPMCGADMRDGDTN